MKLLLSAHLPLLPLEALRPCWSEPGAFVVIEKDVVISMSAEAARAGVRLGMRNGGVMAVSPDTVILEREMSSFDNPVPVFAN